MTDEEYTERIDKICSLIKNGSGLVILSDDNEYRIFNLISFLSVVGSILVFLTTLWNVKLQSHPYTLISTIALIDATYFMIFNTFDETCELKLYQIFSATTFFSLKPRALHASLVLLLRSSLFAFKTLFIISFYLNSFLCVDLYLTVKSPFTPAKSRLTTYFLVAISMGLGVSIAETYYVPED
jgi:hypothetical protein